MTFAQAAQDISSERFFLVEVVGRGRASLVTTAGVNRYKFEIGPDFNILNVYIKTDLVDSADWDYDNQYLYVNSALNLLLSDTNYVTFDFGIYLTGTTLRKTDGIAGLPDATWLPLIKNYPQFSQTMRNIGEGVFSLSNSTLELISTDRWLQKIAAEVSKAPVRVWSCINSEDTYRQIFTGEIGSISYSYGTVSLTLIDTFNRLKDSAFFGTREDAYNNKGNNRTPYLAEADENSPSHLVIGRSSPLIIGKGARQNSNFWPLQDFYHLSDGLKAYPQLTSGVITLPTRYYCGRIYGNDVKRLTFGTVSNGFVQYIRGGYQIQDSSFPLSPGMDYHLLFMMNLSNFNGEIGDYIPNLVVNGTSYKAWCCNNRPFYYNGQWYNAAFIPYITTWRNNWPNPSGAASISFPAENTVPSMSLWTEGTNDCQYRYSRSDGVGVVDIIYAGRYVPFTFVPGGVYLEGGEPILNVYADVIDAGVIATGFDVKCRFSPAESISHGRFMKSLVKSAGMVTNDAAFSQADTDLDAKISLTIPEFQSSSYPSFLEVAQKVTQSTLSTLTVNSNREVEYNVVKSPRSSPIDAVRSSVDMLQGDTQASIEFQDVYSTVTFDNPNFQEINDFGALSYKATVDNDLVKQLYRITRTKEIKHCLESIQSRKDAIAGYFSNPTIEYTLSTASADLTSSLGDIVEITNSAVMTEQTTVGMVVNIDQASDKSTIKINEILGV